MLCEILVVGLLLLAQGEFLHLAWKPSAFAIVWAIWGAPLVAVSIWRARTAARQAADIGFLIEVILPGMALLVVARGLNAKVATGELLYMSGMVAVALAAWRFTARRLEAWPCEMLRLVGVGGAALYGVLAFFTDRLVGGTDAQWYGFLMRDFIEQVRAGVFPVFTSRGEFAPNGGVHPYITAPMYMMVGRVCDWITVRALSPLALQHMTALVAALGAGWGMYAAGVKLAPRRRWAAAAVAIFYALSPGVLLLLYRGEMYMTWMAVGALPWVMYGLARALREGDGQGLAVLAAGLAFTWMCHAPVALLATLACAAMFGLRWLIGGLAPGMLTRIWAAAMLFLVLGAYYFYSVEALATPGGGPGPGDDAKQLLGFALAIIVIVQGVIRRKLPWLLLAVPAGWLLWKSQPAWAVWAGLTAPLALVLDFVVRRLARERASGYTLETLFVSLLVAAAIAGAVLPTTRFPQNGAALNLLRIHAQLHLQFILPVTPGVAATPDCQPGWGLWLMFLLLAAGTVFRRELALRIFFFAALTLVLLLEPVPHLSDFLVSYTPPLLYGITAIPLMIRLMPIIVGLMAIGGVLCLDFSPKRTRARAWLLGAVLAALVMWCVAEAGKFVRAGWGVTADRVETEKASRPENAKMASFNYQPLPVPRYFSHGKTDPRLEVRILDARKKVVVGPDEIARAVEKGGVEKIALRTRLIPNSATYEIEPAITLAPGERRLLRFEFRPDKEYRGWLQMVSAHGFREYILPVSGLDLSFGTGASNTRTVSLWNTGDAPERYTMVFISSNGPIFNAAGDAFATVVSSRFNLALSPVRLDSLGPWHAVVDSPVNGYVESNRAFLRGYRAKVDGQAVATVKSVDALVMFPVAAGHHELELSFVGTPMLWITLLVSSAGWSGWAIYLACRLRRKT